MDLVLMDVVFVGVKRKLKNLVEDLLLLVDREKSPILWISNGSSFHTVDGTNPKLIGSLFI